MSRFTLNFLTLLAVAINIPPGLPVTEAQLARVALAETAAWNCPGPSLSSPALCLIPSAVGLKVVCGCKIGHDKVLLALTRIKS